MNEQELEQWLESTKRLLREAYDRGYFDPHPDDSEAERDMKLDARKLIEEQDGTGQD